MQPDLAQMQQERDNLRMVITGLESEIADLNRRLQLQPESTHTVLASCCCLACGFWS
jgi:hypothetical protein